MDLGKISVGPPYFALLFMLLMAPLVLLLPFGPLTRWQREQASRPIAMLLPWAGARARRRCRRLFPGAAGPVEGRRRALPARYGWHWARCASCGRAWPAGKGNRFTAEMLGMTLAHAGIAVFLIGALLVEGLNQQRELALKPGQSVELGRHAFRFEGVERLQGPNYIADRGTVQVLRDDRPLVTLHPEKRSYASGGQVMTEAGIDARHHRRPVCRARRIRWAAMRWAFACTVKPFVRWIWLGAALMALGGFVAATDRRFRRQETRA